MAKMNEERRADVIGKFKEAADLAKERFGMDVREFGYAIGYRRHDAHKYYQGQHSPTGLRRELALLAHSTLTKQGRMPSREEVAAVENAYASGTRGVFRPPLATVEVPVKPSSMASRATSASVLGSLPELAQREIVQQLKDEVLLWELARRVAARG